MSITKHRTRAALVAAGVLASASGLVAFTMGDEGASRPALDRYNPPRRAHRTRFVRIGRSGRCLLWIPARRSAGPRQAARSEEDTEVVRQRMAAQRPSST